MMPAWLALIFVGTGTALNVLGLYCAAKAFQAAWTASSQEDLWPWITAFADRVRSAASNLAFWRRHKLGAVSGTATCTSSVTGSAYVTYAPLFPPVSSDAARIAFLERNIERIYAQLSADRTAAAQRDSDLSDHLGDVSSALGVESTRLEALSRSLASSGIRLQLVGLMAIGLGTVLTAFPSLWNGVSTVLQRS